jgi:hypothetical protein
MAGLLSIGAGANEGLQEYLAQQLKEKLYEEGLARDAEAKRSNLATEDYRNRSLTETAAQRKVAQDSLDWQRGITAQNQLRDDIRTREQLRPIGTSVDPAEMGQATKIGLMPTSLYQEKGGTLDAQTGNPADQGPTLDVTYAGTEAQQLARKNADKQSSGGATNVKAYTLNGKEIAAQETPAGRVMFQGKDVTDDPSLRIYHTPDRTLVQVAGPGGESIYTPRGQATGKQAPLTAATRTMAEGASMLAPHIDELSQQAEQLDKAGLFGPVMSRLRDAAAKAGSVDELAGLLNMQGDQSQDANVGRFLSTLGLVATGAGRVHGGARGGGSPQMLQHFKDLLTSSSTLQMFQGRLDALNSFMSTYSAGPGGASPAGGSDPTDPLGLGIGVKK